MGGRKRETRERKRKEARKRRRKMLRKKQEEQGWRERKMVDGRIVPWALLCLSDYLGIRMQPPVRLDHPPADSSCSSAKHEQIVLGLACCLTAVLVVVGAAAAPEVDRERRPQTRRPAMTEWSMCRPC